MKRTDLWVEFGNEMPFGRKKISSEDSVKMLAVGNTPSFDKRTVCAFKRIREYVMTLPDVRKGRIDDGYKMDIGAGALI
jgi:hypothetical protein